MTSSSTLSAYTTTIGDGRRTCFTITHQLHSATPMVTVYDKDLNQVVASVTVTGLESVSVDVGVYAPMITHWCVGPLRIPKPWSAKPVPYGPTIPAPDSLCVQVVA